MYILFHSVKQLSLHLVKNVQVFMKESVFVSKKHDRLFHLRMNDDAK